jgi:hypothetical protein
MTTQRRRERLLRGNILFAAITAAWICPLEAQRLTDGQLFQRAVRAYDSLPEQLSPADGPAYAVAVKYMFAYQQRTPARMAQDAQHSSQVTTALDWLATRLPELRAAGSKGDDYAIRTDDVLRDRGLGAYGRLPQGNQISALNTEDFVVALANLYAFRQRSRGPVPAGVRVALARLDRDHSKLGNALGSGDHPSDAGGLPSDSKPLIWGRQVGERSQASTTERIDLTGTWCADDGGMYFIRQIGGRVCWLGQSADQGRSWTNVFMGSLVGNGRTIRGRWVDVPRGRERGSGEMTLRIDSAGRLTAVVKIGGFGGSVWRRGCRGS